MQVVAMTYLEWSELDLVLLHAWVPQRGSLGKQKVIMSNSGNFAHIFVFHMYVHRHLRYCLRYADYEKLLSACRQ